MAPPKTRLFKSPSKIFFVGPMMQKHEREAIRLHEQLKVSEVVERIALEVNLKKKDLPDVKFKMLMAERLGQEILKRIAPPADYKTAIKINSVLVRTVQLKQAFSGASVSKQLLEKVLSDGVKAYRGFGETKNAKTAKGMLDAISKAEGPTIRLSPEEKPLVYSWVESIHNHYYRMLLNLLGEKTVSIFEVLEERAVPELVQKVGGGLLSSN